jgi:hypothetical protein
LSGTRTRRENSRSVGGHAGPPASAHGRWVGTLFVSAVLGFGLLLSAAIDTKASERAEEFLRGLQERGLEELALDYLRSMETSRLASAEFRKRILYHRGLTLLSLSRKSADPAIRSSNLNEARSLLERYAAENPESVEAGEAQIQLGGILLELGKQANGQIVALPAGSAYDTQREKLRGDARANFDDAAALFQRVAAGYEAKLADDRTAGDDSDANPDRGRRELRARLAQAQYLAANVKLELAQTQPAGSAAFRQAHESAAKELAAIADQYSSTQIWGFYARLDEGRCYQALAQFPLALGCFREVISRPSVLPLMRSLIARAYAYQSECLIAQSKFDEAIENSRNWLGAAKDAEDRQPEWLAVRFQYAEALRRKAEALPETSNDRRRLLAQARDEYRTVAATAGAHQTAARTALASLRRGDGGNSPEAKGFTEAYERGKEALSSANAAKQALPSAERNKADSVAELRAQISEGMGEARRYFASALELVESDTDRAALNDVRYFMSWLYWEDGDYYRAAVLSDFLARRYPDHRTAPSAARIAIAAYEQLAKQSQANDGDLGGGDFATRRAVAMAEFVTRRWPGTPDAEAATRILVNSAIRGDRVDDAEKLLAAVSPAGRPALELQLGIAMWSRFLAMSSGEGADKSNAEAQAKVRAAAIKYLRSGVDANRQSKQVNETTVAGAVYLAQALVSAGDAAAAISELEDATTGPLTLIQKKHQAAAQPSLAVQAYDTALRAYASANPPQGEKVVQSIASLEKAIATLDDQPDEQITRIYLSLSGTLQKQINEMRSANRPADAERLVSAFAQILDRVAAKQEGMNWSTRLWVAQSYYNLGGGDDATEAPAAPSSGNRLINNAHLKKARDMYATLLATSAQAAPPPSEMTLLAARFQLGECYRALGEYQQALDAYSKVLATRESSLPVQRAAALAYQARGQAEDPKWFERAIQGGSQERSTGENHIWGWLKLAQVADRAARTDPKYRDAFFEARYQMANCRYLLTMKSSTEKRQESLAQAKLSIHSVARLYPDLGGEKWQPKFDALMKQIQTASGEASIGLNEFKTVKP